ncbi:MAG: sporulation protein [Lachnospiraceae bacterium]|jgi:uncharacterized spore protein YtfJ|nr:sporulation protein [Lachnospiraceae bacterium]
MASEVKKEKNTFENTVENLFKGMDGFLTTKTVVGDAIHLDGTIILPLVDVSFGVGAGAFASDSKNNSGGGMTGKITPSAVLVIQDGHSKLVTVKGQDGISKLLDMVPDIIGKFTKSDKKAKEKEVEIPEDVFDSVK